MGLTGSWRAANVTPAEFAGATQWGTGINPVHALRDPVHHPETTKLPLGAAGPGDVPPEFILGPAQWGYQAEDAALYPGESYRYLRADHPNWGEDSAGRPDRTGAIMDMGIMPQPEGWPAWGVYHDDNPAGGFPLPGPPGGGGVRAYSDQLELERGHAMVIPGPGVSGGWLNKAHGQVNEARTSSPAQYEINTSMVQLHRELDNNRATARGTDDPRSKIGTRLTGVKAKSWPKDINMGGGPAAPDLRPQSTDRIPKRPFTFRTSAPPPIEAHTRNTISYWDGIQRTPPDPAGSYVTVQEASSAPGDYGYTTEDGGYY